MDAWTIDLAPLDGVEFIAAENRADRPPRQLRLSQRHGSYSRIPALGPQSAPVASLAFLDTSAPATLSVSPSGHDSAQKLEQARKAWSLFPQAKRQPLQSRILFEHSVRALIPMNMYISVRARARACAMRTRHETNYRPSHREMNFSCSQPGLRLRGLHLLRDMGPGLCFAPAQHTR